MQNNTHSVTAYSYRLPLNQQFSESNPAIVHPLQNTNLSVVENYFFSSPVKTLAEIKFFYYFLR